MTTLIAQGPNGCRVVKEYLNSMPGILLGQWRQDIDLATLQSTTAAGYKDEHVTWRTASRAEVELALGLSWDPVARRLVRWDRISRQLICPTDDEIEQTTVTVLQVDGCIDFAIVGAPRDSPSTWLVPLGAKEAKPPPRRWRQWLRNLISGATTGRKAAVRRASDRFQDESGPGPSPRRFRPETFGLDRTLEPAALMQRMPSGSPPRVLILQRTDGRARLTGYREDDTCVSDTRHDDEQAARDHADIHYGGSLSCWQQVKTDSLAHARTQARRIANGQSLDFGY
jgi:hypothetical protein